MYFIIFFWILISIYFCSLCIQGYHLDPQKEPPESHMNGKSCLQYSCSSCCFYLKLLNLCIFFFHPSTSPFRHHWHIPVTYLIGNSQTCCLLKPVIWMMYTVYDCTMCSKESMEQLHAVFYHFALEKIILVCVLYTV